MDVVILNRRGLESQLPTLRVGQFYFATDTKVLYIGSSTGNLAISTGILPVANGGTGASSFTANRLVMTNATTTGALIPVSSTPTTGTFLQAAGQYDAPVFANISTSITASASVNSSTAATIDVTGYRMVLVQVWRNATSESYSFWVDLTDTTYNFSANPRLLRFRWWDGFNGWDNTIIVQNNGGLRLQHNAGGTFIFKCTGVR